MPRTRSSDRILIEVAVVRPSRVRSTTVSCNADPRSYFRSNGTPEVQSARTGSAKWKQPLTRSPRDRHLTFRSVDCPVLDILPACTPRKLASSDSEPPRTSTWSSTLCTFFVGFSAEQQRLAKMLRSMTGLVEGTRDAPTLYTEPLTGAYYFVPSVEDLRTLR